MAKMVFYEKPGCINGEKQKIILEAAGNVLQCVNILEHNWSRDQLLPYVTGKHSEQIMNHTAPQIKKGEVVPKNLTFEEAIQLMINDPILIKRPLIEVEGLFIQGFDNALLGPYLGDWDGSEDVLTCPNLLSVSCDEK
jgi:nitrogenase-associated protein